MKDKIIYFVLGAIAVLLIINFYGFVPMRDYGMMGSYWTGGWGWMGLIMFVVWISVVVFLALGIVWLIKQLKK
jgi:uncharacterized membrane protein